MADKFSQTDRNHDVPTLEQIERLKSLSVEEANSATFLFHQFASIYNLPNLAQINQLTANLKIWDERMSPSKTASELERANQELKRLAQSNARMSQEVEELESKKKELELLSAKLKSLQLDYESQMEKNNMEQGWNRNKRQHKDP